MFAAGVIHLVGSRFRLSSGKEAEVFLSCFILSGICVTGLAVPLLYGGDHFASFRQYQPIFPLLLLASLLPAPALLHWLCAQVGSQTLAGFLLLVVPVVAFSYTDTVNWQTVGLEGVSIRAEFDIATGGRRRGRTLQQLFAGHDRLPSVGVTAAGGFKYTYSGEVIDLLGLNNTRMGHSPGLREGMKNHAAWNNDIFFQLSPEIVLTSCNPENPDNWFHDIQLDWRFPQQYDCVGLQKGATSTYMSVAIRKDLLASLQEWGREMGIVLSAPEE
jgi:hypothetical protein